MAEPIVERLKEFLSHKGLNSSGLAELLGYSSPEKIARLFRKEGALPSADIIADVANKFASELNLEWWITGRGTMLKSKDSSQADQTGGIVKEKYIALLELTLTELREEKKQLQQSLNDIIKNQKAIASIALAMQDLIAEQSAHQRKIDLKKVRHELGMKAMQYFDSIGKTDILPVKDK